MRSFCLKSFRLDAIALLAGMLLPFSFAPFSISPLAFITLALLLYTWLFSSPYQAFRRGTLFGIGFFTLGVSWVYISIHRFGQASMPLSVFITVIFILYLSLFFGIQGYCFTRYLPESRIKPLLVFPCTFVLFEMLRGWLFTGFPWLLLGYSQGNTWLRGYAPISGVYGVSFVTAFLAALLLLLVRRKSTYFRVMGMASFAAIFGLGLILTQINWTQPIGHPLQTTLIQGNIAQEVKWQPEQLRKTLEIYMRYTTKNWLSDIVIWPEAAITLPLSQMQDFLKKLGEIAQKKRVTIITGIPIVDSEMVFNSIITLGNGSGTYHKRHLVPFGEYIPLKPLWHFILDAFHIPMSSFQPGGKKQLPLTAKGVVIAPYICYEVAYPLEFLHFLPEAQLLLTITDDSWFGHSIAAAQHLQIAQMRALETGRYLIFSSNMGITAVLNSKGQVVKTIPPFQEAALTARIQPMAGYTPWMIFKTYPLMALLLLTLFRARSYRHKQARS
jgi:apolipoprotein N-acyltransferase